VSKLISVLGLFVFIGIAFLLSKNKKAINIRLVVTGLLLQFLIALLVLKSQVAASFFESANHLSQKILSFSSEGATFVFGALGNIGLMSKTFGPSNAFIFGISVTSTVIFIGALMAILYYFGIMQFIIKITGRIMEKIMGTSGAESIACAANVFSGMTEAPLVIRPYLSKLTKSELMALLTGGLATIAGSVLIVYVSIGVEAGHLLAASLMSAPAALVIAKIMIPEVEKPLTDGSIKLFNDEKDANFLDAACRGASDGMKLAINIMAMLIAMVALVALFNYILTYLGSFVGFKNLTMQQIAGYVFSPFAFLMGIPSEDILKVGQLLGEKTILNEFIAYSHLATIKGSISPRSFTIATYALCGFANIGSIAIQIGGISILVPSRRKELAKLSFYSLIGGTLACFMTATIAGILI
jgi:concentrative nucleoside transporter, CNT family